MHFNNFWNVSNENHSQGGEAKNSRWELLHVEIYRRKGDDSRNIVTISIDKELLKKVLCGYYNILMIKDTEIYNDALSILTNWYKNEKIFILDLCNQKKKCMKKTEIILCTEVENREYYRRYFNLS